MRAVDGGEGTALAGQVDAGDHGVVAHELHHLGAEFLPFGGAVAHAHVVHQVRQAHDAQADAAVAAGGFLQLGHSRDVLVGVHHIIQEAGGVFRRFAQLLPIHLVVGGEVLGQVDRTQAAVLVGSQILLTAGVGGFQLVEMGDGIAAVGGIQEEHARLAVVVGLLDDLLEELAGAHALVDLERDARILGLLERAVEVRGSAGRAHPGISGPSRRRSPRPA